MRRATLLGAKFDECRACHQPGPHLLLRTTLWFSIFRIPIVFVWMSHGILCPECGDLEPVGFLAMRRAMKTGMMPLGRARPRFEAIIREQLGGADPADWAAFGLEPGASPDDVRARWRELAKTLHPDRGGDPAAFVQMNAVYQRLVASPDVRVSAPPDPREVFDPVVVNRKRGFFDVYLKAWPVMVGLLVVSSSFSLPSPAASAGSPSGGSGNSIPSGTSPVAKPTSPAPLPTLPSQATPRPSPTSAPRPIGWACAFSAHPSTQIWIYPATELVQDCSWVTDSIALDPGETTQMILNPHDLVPTDPTVCEFQTAGSHVAVVTDSAVGHVVGDSLCKIFGAPANVSAFTQRGQAYYLDGKYDLALADLDKAIELDPANAIAFTVRGYAYSNTGADDLAVADLTKAIKLDPTLAVAYQGRGAAYYLERRYDLAIADFTRSIELDPKVVTVYAGRGLAYMFGSKYDLAIADFSEAIKLAPEDASNLMSRGNAYRNDGQLDRAITDYTKAIELDPSSPWAFQARGGARGANGDLAGATDDFERALSLTSDPALISNIKAVRCSVGLACE